VMRKEEWLPYRMAKQLQRQRKMPGVLLDIFVSRSLASLDLALCLSRSCSCTFLHPSQENSSIPILDAFSLFSIWKGQVSPCRAFPCLLSMMSVQLWGHISFHHRWFEKFTRV
jgi:hypothetical protein